MFYVSTYGRSVLNVKKKLKNVFLNNETIFFEIKMNPIIDRG